MFTIFSKKVNYPLQYLLGFDFNSIPLRSICRLSNENTITLNSELLTNGESKLAITVSDQSIENLQLKNFIWEKAARFEALLYEHNIPKKVHYALVHSINYKLDQTIKNNDLITLDNHYIFLKEQQDVKGINIKDFIFDIQARNLIPVFVFPEKCLLYNSNRKELNHLIKRGVTFQIDWLSLTGYYGNTAKKTATYLLEIKAVKFIGFEKQNLIALVKSKESKVCSKISRLLNDQLFS